MTYEGRRFQYVWWGWRRLLFAPVYCPRCGEWTERYRLRWPIFNAGPYPGGGEIYRWRLVLGPLEIRRWA